MHAIILSDDIRHDAPAAYMVFANDSEIDYMVFPEKRDADDYAQAQAEVMERESWPVYALWAADLWARPQESGENANCAS